MTIVLLTIACLQLRWENFVKWHVAEALEIEAQSSEQFVITVYSLHCIFHLPTYLFVVHKG